jgi:Holliday junction resolvase
LVPSNEKAIVNAIKKALQGRGAWVIKTHGSPSLSGLPDIIACYEGRFVGIEVKKPTTRHTVTLRQQAVLDMIAQSGGITGVATSVEEALNLIV